MLCKLDLRRLLFGSLLPLWLVLTLPSSGSADDEPASALLREANANYRELHTERAVNLYREYLSRYADRADVRVWLGAALLNLNWRKEALIEAEHALALDGNLAKAHTLKGRILAADDRLDLASLSFDTALKLDARDADAWYFAGRASLTAERFEKAIGQFQHVLQLGRTQSRVYTNLGRAFEALGRTADAESAFRKAVAVVQKEARPNDYEPSLAYGIFLFREQRMPESISMLHTSLLLAPDRPEVRFELGRALYQSGQLVQAADTLTGAAASSDCRVLNLLSRVHRTMGKGTEADRDLEAWDRCNRTQP